MPTYRVTVGDNEYDVDAPDPDALKAAVPKLRLHAAMKQSLESAQAGAEKRSAGPKPLLTPTGETALGVAKEAAKRSVMRTPLGVMASWAEMPGKALTAGETAGDWLAKKLFEAPPEAPPAMEAVRAGAKKIVGALGAPARAMEAPFAPTTPAEATGATVGGRVMDVADLLALGAGGAGSVAGRVAKALPGTAGFLGGEELGRRLGGTPGAIAGSVLGAALAHKLGLPSKVLSQMAKAGAEAPAVAEVAKAAEAAVPQEAKILGGVGGGPPLGEVSAKVTPAIRGAMEAAAEGGALARAGRIGRQMGLSQAEADAIVAEIKAAQEARPTGAVKAAEALPSPAERLAVAKKGVEQSRVEAEALTKKARGSAARQAEKETPAAEAEPPAAAVEAAVEDIRKNPMAAGWDEQSIRTIAKARARMETNLRKSRPDLFTPEATEQSRIRLAEQEAQNLADEQEAAALRAFRRGVAAPPTPSAGKPAPLGPSITEVLQATRGAPFKPQPWMSRAEVKAGVRASTSEAMRAAQKEAITDLQKAGVRVLPAQENAALAESMAAEIEGGAEVPKMPPAPLGADAGPAAVSTHIRARMMNAGWDAQRESLVNVAAMPKTQQRTTALLGKSKPSAMSATAGRQKPAAEAPEVAPEAAAPEKAAAPAAEPDLMAKLRQSIDAERAKKAGSPGQASSVESEAQPGLGRNDFSDYKEAAREARARATRTGLDISIRAHDEYGKKVYTIRFASKNDSDYAKTEIIHPGEPQVAERISGATIPKGAAAPEAEKAAPASAQELMGQLQGGMLSREAQVTAERLRMLAKQPGGQKAIREQIAALPKALQAPVRKLLLAGTKMP